MCELLSLTDVLLLFVRVRNAHMMFSYYSESAEPSILVILKKRGALDPCHSESTNLSILAIRENRTLDPYHSGKLNSRSLPFESTELPIISTLEFTVLTGLKNVVFSNPTV